MTPQSAPENTSVTRPNIASAAWFRALIILIGLVFSVLVSLIFSHQFPFPKAISNQFDFPGLINSGEDWLKDNIRSTTRAIAAYVTGFISGVEEFLWLKPWPLVLAALTLISLRFGGLRFAIFAAAVVLFWGMVGQWDPTMSTLALMGVSVFISILLGVPLGIWCAMSTRTEAIVRPILDTMQTMPAFVYLLPAIFFFGIGETGAAMAIIVYAMPPVVRLTTLGIRQVPATSIEVAESFGSTGFQILRKVQLPQAIPSVILGINQTIMMALGLAVLAVFIGTGGLGREVYSALTKLKVGWAFEAGLCIVLMAVLFDRLTLAMGQPRAHQNLADPAFRLLPQSWRRIALARAIETVIDRIWQIASNFFAGTTGIIAGTVRTILTPFSPETALDLAARINRSRFLISLLLILVAIYVWDLFLPIGYFPESWQFSIREPVDNAVDWLAADPSFAAFSKGLRALIYLYLLNPLDQFFVGLPWFVTLAALFLIARATGGLRFGVVITALIFLTGVAGMWEPTMETLSATITAVVICIIVGLPVGIASAYSKTLDSIVRPILDTMQTMPAFVYLIPVLMLFGGNKVTAIIATVIYAIPPMVRMTTLGLRQLPEQINEVCTSFGSTELQSLFKIKLPMASPSIMLGVNQAIVMALAMQVITPMIAGEGLGKVVFSAMATADTGTGLVAGTGIVLLAIVLDRMTQSWTTNQRKALGL